MSGTEAPPTADKDHERTWQLVIVVLGVIGAVLALVPVVLGLFDDGDEHAGPATSTSVSTTTARPTTTAPPITTTAATATTSSVATSPSAVPPGIFHETGGTPIPVPEGYGVDLDSPASNWGVTASSSRDFYVTAGATSIGGSSSDREVQFAIVQEPPTFEECEAQTALQTVVPVEQTVEGQHLCVLSSQGRWAYVNIARIDQNADEMAFHIQVWKLPTDP